MKAPVPKLSELEFAIVMDLFPRLTASVREALKLVFVFGYTIGMAAERTGKCRNVIGNRVRSIRQYIEGNRGIY